MTEFRVFTQVLSLDQSRAEVIKTHLYCRVSDLGVNAELYTFPLHTKA